LYIEKSDGHLLSNMYAARVQSSKGFTLIELTMTTVIAALLVAIAVPSYARVIQRQKTAQAERDLRVIALAIERYRTQHGTPPDALDQLGMPIPRDPWNQDYQFLNFGSNAPGVSGMIRKDHNLHPLNSEFDLYSIGPDGSSSPPLTARASQDDIIWARDGAFVGPAEDY
jgi:general secretion pathway protein G